MIKTLTKLALLLVMLSCATGLTQAQSILRGPYLQSPGPNSIIVRWRTDSLTSSRVTYGTTQGATTFTADSATLTTEHRVLLKGLTPLTKYYYSVGTTSQQLRGNDPLLYFTTAPDSNSHTPIRVWTIGDFGHGNTGERDVRNSYYAYAANKPANFQLWVGDNAYQDGTDQEFQDKVFDTVNCYGNTFLNLPFVSTSGNHDYNSICPWQPSLCGTDPDLHTGPYLNIIDPPTEGELGGVASHRKLFYSMDYGDVHFVILNSELGSFNAAYNWSGVLNNDTAFTSPMLEWLKADLAATTKKWKVAVWHQCPYSAQDNFTDNGVQIFCIATRKHFNPIIEKYGVDLVLTGHDHNYQRSYLINGLYDNKSTFTPQMMINGGSGAENLGEEYVKYTYGPTAGKGTVYVIAGNGSEGNSPSSFDHPAIFYGHTCDTCYGSFILDIDGDRLDGRYLTSKGQILDHFTMRKETGTGITEENAAFDHFYVYPNPFHEQTSVGYTVNSKCPVTIDVLDAAGRVVYNYKAGMKEPGAYQAFLDLDRPNISAGSYLIRLDCGGVIKYRKVVRTE